MGRKNRPAQQDKLKMKNHVVKFSGLNWQGRTFTTELAPLTAIIGKNLSGKSSVPNGLRVGMIGYSPKHGKSNAANWGFIGSVAGATQGGVELGFEGGQVNRLVFETKKGKIECKEKLLAVTVPPALMDLQEEFFKLSGPKRTDFVFGKMDMAALGFSVEEITARLKRNVKATSPSEETELALGSIIEDVEDLDRSRIDAGWNYQEWLAQVSAKIKGRADVAKGILDQMAGLIQGTTVLQGTEAPLAPFSATELSDARTKLAELRAAKNSAASAIETRNRLTAARDAYAAAKPVDHGAEIEKTNLEIKAIQEKWEGFESKVEPMANLRTEISTHLAIIKNAVADREKELAEREQELKSDRAAKCCPKCKSKSKAWKDFIASEEKRIEVLKDEIETHKKSLVAIASEFDGADAAYQKQHRLAQECQEAVQSVNGKLATVKQLEAAQKNCTVTLPHLGGFRSETITIEAAKAKRESLDEQLKTAPEAKAPPSEAEISAAEAKVNELADLERKHIAKKQDALRAEEGRAKHDNASAEKEICTLAYKEIEAIKTELMEKAFGEFMAKVELFTAGFFRNSTTGLIYRDGEIGYMRGAAWVSLDHFCGTEEMLTYIGLAVALAQDSPVRIVIVDEWLRDEVMRAQVAARLAGLVNDNVIDQAIVIDTQIDPYNILEYKIVEMS